MIFNNPSLQIILKVFEINFDVSKLFMPLRYLFNATHYSLVFIFYKAANKARLTLIQFKKKFHYNINIFDAIWLTSGLG